MSYEKKYKEALERAREKYHAGCLAPALLEYIFPELKENENEKMWKLLEKYVHRNLPEGVFKADHITREQLESWIKKQGEQNLTDKIKPMFEVGDVMRTLQEAFDGDTNGMPVVVSIDKEYYHCNNESIAIKDQDNYEYPPINRRSKYNLKSGDIVAADPVAGYPGPFVAIFQEYGINTFSSYCYVGFNGGFHKGQQGHAIENIHPATREQYNILFTRMKEAGYKWDSNKKELKKIK